MRNRIQLRSTVGGALADIDLAQPLKPATKGHLVQLSDGRHRRISGPRRSTLVRLTP